MKTITVKVPDFLNDILDAAAADRNVTKSEIVRDLLSVLFLQGVGFLDGRR